MHVCSPVAWLLGAGARAAAWRWNVPAAYLRQGGEAEKQAPARTEARTVSVQEALMIHALL